MCLFYIMINDNEFKSILPLIDVKEKLKKEMFDNI